MHRRAKIEAAAAKRVEAAEVAKEREKLRKAQQRAAIEERDRRRASGEMAAHLVDIMQSVLEAAESGCKVDLVTTMTRPAPLPANG